MNYFFENSPCFNQKIYNENSDFDFIENKKLEFYSEVDSDELFFKGKLDQNNYTNYFKSYMEKSNLDQINKINKENKNTINYNSKIVSMNKSCISFKSKISIVNKKLMTTEEKELLKIQEEKLKIKLLAEKNKQNVKNVFKNKVTIQSNPSVITKSNNTINSNDNVIKNQFLLKKRKDDIKNLNKGRLFSKDKNLKKLMNLSLIKLNKKTPVGINSNFYSDLNLLESDDILNDLSTSISKLNITEINKSKSPIRKNNLNKLSINSKSLGMRHHFNDAIFSNQINQVKFDIHSNNIVNEYDTIKEFNKQNQLSFSKIKKDKDKEKDKEKKIILSNFDNRKKKLKETNISNNFNSVNASSIIKAPAQPKFRNILEFNHVINSIK